MTSLLDRLIKASKEPVTVLSKSEMFQEPDFVDTGIPILNIAFSGKPDGGFGPGISMIAGLAKSFKTMIALMCMGKYLEKYDDAIGILYDSEGGVTPSYLRKLNIDADRVLHIPVSNVEHLKFDMVQKLKELRSGDHVFFMLDSLGMISSNKEIEDADNAKIVADMTRAKAIRSFLRLVTMDLSVKRIPFFVVNHVYSETGLFPKTVLGGGCLAENTEVRMYDGSKKNIQDIKVGDLVQTLNGPKPIIQIWNSENLDEPTPECFEIEFENGEKIECSYNHKFLTTNRGWVKAEDLTTEDDLVSVC